MVKLQKNDDGEKEITTLSVSQTLQIAGTSYTQARKPIDTISHRFLLFFAIGRAGRFGTQWEQGYVTTFKPTDLHLLKYLLGQKPEPIEQAGLQPTSDQIELYSYHLPNSSLNSLLVRTIFV